MLQEIGDGRIIDSQGRTVDFKNTVVILASNLGSRRLLEGVTGDIIPESVRESVMTEVRTAFRPESLNRIDEGAGDLGHPAGDAAEADQAERAAFEFDERDFQWQKSRQALQSPARTESACGPTWWQS